MQTAYARMVYGRYQQRTQRGDGVQPRRTTTFAHLLKDLCRRLVAFMFTQVGVCGLVVAYNIMGAFVFRAIEGEHGDAAPEEAALHLREDAVRKLWNITARLNILDQGQWRQEVTGALEDFQDRVVPLVKAKGYRGVYPSQAWSFSAALMYSLSVYTTIGYGNLTPRTEWGKIVTILYAIVGMPLMLLYMSNIGEVLAHIFKFIYFRVCSCDVGSLGYYRTASGNLRPVPVNARRGDEAKEGGKRGQGSRRTVPITYCLLVIAVYVACGGAIFSQWERWSLLDACYFSYISLSTIGLGTWCDVALSPQVPGRTVAGKSEEDEVESQQIIVTVYLLVGSALVAMCFNLMQEETIENLKSFWRKLGCLRKNDDGESSEGPSVSAHGG
ncbi:TWiK family of potassium channels protein 18 [Chionoecetes opilio]|uniref:TWiK family of potassium channels protein 18 n=1 Tax=Chionoecetes opilio TaxID=41210 RepID=A0A8J4YQK8_CHIOP|nr:TWiK family of potassium channels protein 18 [Chionoecetes opilio]